MIQGGNQVLLLNGLGGIGKTTLAKKYLHSHYNYYDHIAWVSVLLEGSSEEEGFQSAAEALGRDPKLFNNLGIPFDLEESDQVRTQRVLEAFEQLPGKNLLIIDNAGFSLKDIRTQLPNPPEWHVLVTSRKEIPGLYPRRIHELSSDKALELFFIHYPQGYKVKEQIESLIAYIGYHTLTVELFAKTCRKSPSVNPALILEKLKGKKFEELSRKVWVEHSDREVEVYGYLLAIFELADSELESKELEILTQLSVLPSEEYNWEFLVEVFQVDEKERETFEIALMGLVEKGWVLGEGTYKAHQLIQEIIRYKFPPKEENCIDIIQGISSLLNMDQYKDNPVYRFPYIIYGEAILSHVKSEGKAINQLMNNLAMVYKAQGRYAEAVELYQRALKFDLKSFGEDHPKVARTRNNLAKIYDAQGRYEEAIELYQLALQSSLKSFGEDHPNVATTRSNLALVYYAQGQYEEAIELYELSLQSDLNSLGEDHPSVAITRNGMAMVYYVQGRYEEAIELFELSLQSNLKSFGEDHPSVATTRSNLAVVYKDQSRYEEAIELYELSLQSDLKSLGEDHPSVAIKRNNLAEVYDAQGRYEEAIELYQLALQSDLKSLGEDHPKVATTRNGLALVYKNQSRYEEAIELFELVLKSNLKSLGEDHPYVATTRNNLALVYKNQGRYEEAIELYELALKSDLKSFGEDHPWVATTRNNLAEVYDAQGRYEEAIELYELAMQSDLKSLGEDHPYVATTRNGLALVYKNQGRYEEAIEFFELALKSYLKSLGEDHPKVARTRNNLAEVYKKMKRGGYK